MGYEINWFREPVTTTELLSEEVKPELVLLLAQNAWTCSWAFVSKVGPRKGMFHQGDGVTYLRLVDKGE